MENIYTIFSNNNFKLKKETSKAAEFLTVKMSFIY